MAEQYTGWEIKVTVAEDSLGDMSDVDAAASCAAYVEEYEGAILAAYPGAQASVRFDSVLSGKVEINGTGQPWGEWYESECLAIQGIGEAIFEYGTFWREKAESATSKWSFPANDAYGRLATSCRETQYGIRDYEIVRSGDSFRMIEHISASVEMFDLVGSTLEQAIADAETYIPD